MQKLILALDIDGVLRKGNRAYDGLLDPGAVAALDLLRQHLELLIVITSTWKDVHELPDLQRIIGGDVIGVTESLPPALAPKHPRYHEVLGYIKENRLDGLPWIAFDDDRDAYPVTDNVYFTDPEIGLTQDIAHKVIMTYSTQGKSTVQASHSLDSLVTHNASTGIVDYSGVAKAISESIGLPLDMIGKLVSGTQVGDPRVIIRNLIESAVRGDELRLGKPITYDASDFHTSE